MIAAALSKLNCEIMLLSNIDRFIQVCLIKQTSKSKQIISSKMMNDNIQYYLLCISLLYFLYFCHATVRSGGQLSLSSSHEGLSNPSSS